MVSAVFCSHGVSGGSKKAVWFVSFQLNIKEYIVILFSKTATTNLFIFQLFFNSRKVTLAVNYRENLN